MLGWHLEALTARQIPQRNVPGFALLVCTAEAPPPLVQPGNIGRQPEPLLLPIDPASPFLASGRLFPGAHPEDGDEDWGLEDLVGSSGKMQVLDKILDKLQDRGHRVVIFSQVGQGPQRGFAFGGGGGSSGAGVVWAPAYH